LYGNKKKEYRPQNCGPKNHRAQVNGAKNHRPKVDHAQVDHAQIGCKEIDRPEKHETDRRIRNHKGEAHCKSGSQRRKEGRQASAENGARGRPRLDDRRSNAGNRRHYRRGDHPPNRIGAEAEEKPKIGFGLAVEDLREDLHGLDESGPGPVHVRVAIDAGDGT